MGAHAKVLPPAQGSAQFRLTACKMIFMHHVLGELQRSSRTIIELYVSRILSVMEKTVEPFVFQCLSVACCEGMCTSSRGPSACRSGLITPEGLQCKKMISFPVFVLLQLTGCSDLEALLIGTW